MGVMHAPALNGAWRACVRDGMSVELLGGCLILTASMLFFVLKFFGVAFVQFRTDRRARVALLLAVGLIHLDCFQSVIRGASAADCAAVIATTSLAGGFVHVGRTWSKSSVRAGRLSRPQSSLGWFTGNVWLDDSRPRCWVLASHLFRLRAPPA